MQEGRNWKGDRLRPDLLGGPFNSKENKAIMNSVIRYIKRRKWKIDEGLKKVIRTTKHREAHGCWIEIAKCLPSRPVKAIYTRARRLIEDYNKGKWSVNEVERLTRLQKQHGEDWAAMAADMNRTADLCKDKWRHQKMVPTRITGPWSQEELDQLCELVRISRQTKKLTPPKKVDRRKIREDLNWEWISEEMKRDSAGCAEKLLDLGAVSEKDLDWEILLRNKEGDLCKKRWKEMTRRLDRTQYLSFEEKLKLLVRRYAPDLLEDEVSCE